MNLKKTVTSLTRNGYIVSVFRTKEEAVHYLNEQIDHTSVGMGGSVTLQQMDIYEQLAAHNEVFWHWHNTDGRTADDTRRAARICNAMVIHYRKMLSCDMEVILIEESLGY